MLTFDAEKHLYRLDGQALPSVTQVLQGVGLIDRTWFTEYARTRGTYVHEAARLFDENDLDWESLDPAIRMYVLAYCDFRATTNWPLSDIELPVASATYGYAGTIDRVFNTTPIRTVIDIKTGQPEPWHDLQLAAYAAALGEPCKRVGLYLSDDGKWTTKTYSERAAESVFLSALAIFNWKARNR